MLEGADPEPEQARLRGADEPEEGGPAQEVEGDGEGGREQAGSGDEAGTVPVVAEHAAAEDLLDEDRDHELAGGRRDGEHDREDEPLLELRGHRQAAAEHVHRAGAAEGLLFSRLVGVASLVVVAPWRRRVREHVDDGVEVGLCRIGHAASAS